MRKWKLVDCRCRLRKNYLVSFGFIDVSSSIISDSLCKVFLILCFVKRKITVLVLIHWKAVCDS